MRALDDKFASLCPSGSTCEAARGNWYADLNGVPTCRFCEERLYDDRAVSLSLGVDECGHLSKAILDYEPGPDDMPLDTRTREGLFILLFDVYVKGRLLLSAVEK